jgi:hypothetical protein
MLYAVFPDPNAAAPGVALASSRVGSLYNEASVETCSFCGSLSLYIMKGEAEQKKHGGLHRVWTVLEVTTTAFE